MKHLIINGDDLGLCKGVNRGIFDLHRRGIVTSASLLVDGMEARQAVATLQEKYPDLSLGIHLKFGCPPFKIGGLREETERQWSKFIELTGSSPTHADIHRYPDLSAQVCRFLPERVPLRNQGSINYINKFNGCDGEDAVSLASLIKIFKRVKKGIYELSCHPGYEPIEHEEEDADCGGCREVQLNTLVDERVDMILQMRRIKLISYDDVFKRDQFRIHILDRYYIG